MNERIGPYLIRGILGRGGMGEVFLAYDERLDREVALKRVLAKYYVNDRIRQRFRQEAMIQAKLNHSAIVRLYDLIERESDDILVFEYIRGPNLRNYLAEINHSMETKLRIAAQIASGLVHAHRNQVIHRDIKSENILIDEHDQVKITDFGIAKAADQTTRLTGTQQVVGSVFTLSPEQANGKAVDHRSDIFSFGVLLYEIFTGIMPFRGDSYAEILGQICYEEPIAPKNVNPDIPHNLDALIRQCLAKNPQDRPQLTEEVYIELERQAQSFQVTTASERETQAFHVAPARRRANPVWLMAVLVLLLAIPLGWWQWQDSEQPAFYVAVLDPEWPSEGPPPDWFPMIREACMEGLTQMVSTFPVDPATVDQASSNVSEVADAAATNEIIKLEVTPGTSLWTIYLRRLDGRTASIISTESIDIMPNDPQLIDEAIRAMVLRQFPNRKLKKQQDSFISKEDYREFLRIRQSLDARTEDVREHFQNLKEILERSKKFTPLYSTVGEAARYSYHETRDQIFIEEGYKLTRQGIQLLPLEPAPRLALAQLAMANTDWDLTEAMLTELERAFPGFIEAQALRAKLLEAQGQNKAALAMMLQVTNSRPTWMHRFNLANMAFRQGETELSRNMLQELLRLTPGNIRATRLLANLEMTQGSPAIAADLYAELSEHAPSVYVLTNMGLSLMLAKRYAEAKQSFTQALDLRPNNPVIQLNLADALWLSGEIDSAELQYRNVIEALSPATEDASWSDLSMLAQAYAHLGDTRLAIESIQTALRHHDKNPQVTYAAGLVFALIGDNQSAKVYAEQTLQNGMDARWFEFPWFDGIRQETNFKATTQ